jgi:hypothetical protein
LLQIVIDDSGRGQEKNPAFVLAGYIARVQNWEAFADRWQALLAKAPKLDYLKAYEAYWLCDQFKDWTETERDQKLFELIALIRQYSPLSVTLAINGKAFDGFLKAHKGALKNVYPLALAAIMTKVLRYRLEQQTFEKLDFVFDMGMLHANLFEQAFKDMMVALPERATKLIGKRPHMEDDLEFLPLQAADLLASYVRFKLAAEARGKIFKNKVWDALCDCGKNLNALIATEGLRELRRLLLAG